MRSYDESWKEALNEYFESFLIFFFPEVHQLIDWTQTPRSLDKELQEITASSATEKRIADKLYQVWLLDKRVIWILIHIEIQSQYEVAFGERMYVYNYRSFDLYHKPVVSLAVLGDESNKWRPNTYSYAIGGCEVSLKFPIAKLLDYESRWQELETKRMFEKWYSVIFITLLPPFPLVKGGNNKNPVPSPLQGEG